MSLDGDNIPDSPFTVRVTDSEDDPLTVRAPGRELKRDVEGMRAELTVNPQGLCNQVGF